MMKEENMSLESEAAVSGEKMLKWEQEWDADRVKENHLIAHLCPVSKVLVCFLSNPQDPSDSAFEWLDGCKIFEANMHF